MADWLPAVFGLVCGQEPTHTWSPGGVLLPFCQRCTGFYAGAAVALVLHLALRIRPGARFLQVHGAFLLLMIPLGYHWVPQGALVRTLSGVLYGTGVVSFLWLFPGPRLGGSRAIEGRRAGLYASGVVAALAVVPASGAWGGRPAWLFLVVLGSAGLANLAALAVANLWLGLGALVVRLPRHARSGHSS
jgi:uncharacterized membrane protein